MTSHCKEILRLILDRQEGCPFLLLCSDTEYEGRETHQLFASLCRASPRSKKISFTGLAASDGKEMEAPDVIFIDSLFLFLTLRARTPREFFSWSLQVQNSLVVFFTEKSLLAFADPSIHEFLRSKGTWLCRQGADWTLSHPTRNGRLITERYTVAGGKFEVAASKGQESEPDCYSKLSFNVYSTDEQQQQKKSLQLPHYAARAEPVIIYTHDATDDVDEDDPDADLDY